MQGRACGVPVRSPEALTWRRQASTRFQTQEKRGYIREGRPQSGSAGQGACGVVVLQRALRDVPMRFQEQRLQDASRGGQFPPSSLRWRQLSWVKEKTFFFL